MIRYEVTEWSTGFSVLGRDDAGEIVSETVATLTEDEAYAEADRLAARSDSMVKAAYPDGVCPDCGEGIPDDAPEGYGCSNCGHACYSQSK